MWLKAVVYLSVIKYISKKSTNTVILILTDDLNWDKDIVREIGSLAKDVVG